MTYLPGKTIAESPLTKHDLYHVGQMVATVDKTLQIVSLKDYLIHYSSQTFRSRLLLQLVYSSPNQQNLVLVFHRPHGEHSGTFRGLRHNHIVRNWRRAKGKVNVGILELFNITVIKHNANVAP